jgi:hypothetical protein
MKKTLLALLSGVALLSACGVVPLPAVSIPDQSLSLPSSAGFENYVTYDGSDAFGGTTLPGLLSNVSVSGNVDYAGTGSLRQVAVYLRSALPGCLQVVGSKTQLCDAEGEAAQRIGTISLQNGVVTGFNLSGAALDASAKAGHGYFGVQALQGSSLAGDTLKLSSMKASAKF